MSSVNTNVAPIMSILVVIYSICCLHAYLGLPSIKYIDVSQSYFATTKLSAICLGYMFDAICQNKFENEYSYSLMTLLLTLDALYGFN